jgi:long-chain acyl-CoA synthetase
MQTTHVIQVFRAHARQWTGRTAQRTKVDGRWLEVTWGELGHTFDLAARGLMALGHASGDRVGLCARNLPEWTQADLGILAARGVTVPLYPTSTLEQAQFILRDAGIRILVAGEQAQVDLGLQLLEAGDLSWVIVLDPAASLPDDDRVLGFQALLALGAGAAWALELDRRTAEACPEDLFTLVYTSGTTGEPKGVMLDHANLSAALRLHSAGIDVGPEDVSLCMLPLTHIYERIWTFYVLFRGAINVYLRDPQTVIQVIGEVRPTLMCAVPRVYEKAYAGIHEKMDKAGGLTRILFHWAEGVGAQGVRARMAGPRPGPWLALRLQVADRLIFRKVRALFGGRCRFFPVGGGRLSDEVNLFFQGLGLTLKFGYGLTETCATVSCYEDGTVPLGTVGRPLAGLDVKLGEDHEILVKGPTVMRGYYRRPEDTAAAFTADGYFRTGDAGALDATGHLIFTERIKELMKTSNGQYVAPQKVEGALASDPFIEQVAIIADERNFVSALIVPDLERLEAWAKALGYPYRNLTELLANGKVLAFFEGRLQELQKGLARHEQVKRFTLLPRGFSQERGEMTPTLKLRRKRIEAEFRAEIEAMYAKPRLQPAPVPAPRS